MASDDNSNQNGKKKANPSKRAMNLFATSWISSKDGILRIATAFYHISPKLRQSTIDDLQKNIPAIPAAYPTTGINQHIKAFPFHFRGRETALIFRQPVRVVNARHTLSSTLR